MSSREDPGHVSARYASALAAVLALGVGLRLLQYGAANSLWLDELLIALNVTRSGWMNLLFQPLDYNQVAPIGFLAVEKLAATTLGTSEIALRLFPTIFALVSLVLFWRVSRRFLDGMPLLAALFLFAVNPVFLWTARNVKQYSGDVMVSLLLVLLALRFQEGKDDARSVWTMTIVGGIALLLSQPAVLVGLLLGAILLIQRARSSDRARLPRSFVVGWGIGVAVVTVTSLVLAPPSTRSFMLNGWRGAFITAPWDDPLSLPRLLVGYVAYLFGSMIPDTPPEIAVSLVLLVTALLGTVSLTRMYPARLMLLAAPLVVVVIAAAVRLLPFSGRVSAYAGPTIIVAFAGGLAVLRDRLPPRLATAGAGALLGVAALPALAQLFLIPPFHRREDARPVLEEVQVRWRPGDELYTLHGGRRAMEFYGEAMNLVPWVAGADHGFAPRAYLREVDRWRGRPRVWFFYTHAERCEPEAVISYLDTIGTRIHSIQDRSGNQGKREAAAYLYDLSDPDRLARSRAGKHPVPRNVTDCDRPPISQGEMIKRELRQLLPRGPS